MRLVQGIDFWGSAFARSYSLATPFAIAITADRVAVGLRAAKTDTSAVVGACLSHLSHQADPMSYCSDGLTNSQATDVVAAACY